MQETDPQATRRQPDVLSAAVIRKVDRRRIGFPASGSGIAGDVVSRGDDVGRVSEEGLRSNSISD